MHYQRRASSTAALALYFAVGGSAIAQVRYSLTDLGDLPGGENWSIGNAINNLGEVAGTSSYGLAGGTSLTHAFRWTPTGGMEEIATIAPGDYIGEGWGINDLGDVVGTTPVSGMPHSSFLAPRGGGMIEVPRLWPDTNNVVAYSINNDRVVAGGSFSSTRGQAGFRWTYPVGLTELPSAATTGTVTYVINAGGAAAGFSRTATRGATATYWSPSGAATNIGYLPTNGTPAGSFAFGMNDAGAVVGWSLVTPITGTSRARAFIWSSDTGIHDLGDFGTPDQDFRAWDINNRNEVVGQALVTGQTVNLRGFVQTEAAGMRDLNTLLDDSGIGWVVSNAAAINDRGQIVGNAYNLSGQYTHAVLLTPVPASFCGGDFNRSGIVSVQDIFDYFAAYFAGDTRADINQSGTLSVQDIFDFLAAYFTPCP